jgi:HK97 family phage major capsid protein
MQNASNALSARLGEINEEMKRIVNKAEAEGRQTTGAEQRRVEELSREFSEVEDKITRTVVAETAERTSKPQPRVSQPVDAIPSARTVAPVIGANADTVKFLATFARTGVRTIQNAMSIGSLPDGGYEVPVQLDSELQTVAASYSPLLKLAKVVDGATDGYVQNVATTLPASAWKTESDARGITASPNIAQVTFQRGAVAAVVQCSQWVLQDAERDMYAFLVSELGRQFGSAIGTAITTGAAAQPAPKGLTAATLAATADGARAFGTVEYLATGGATTAPTLDNCITLMSKMHPSYLEGAAWLMSPTAAAALMTQKASTAGSYMWQTDLAAGQPPTLFGKPVYIDPTLPAATTGNACSVWLGHWPRAYTVVRYGRPILVRDDVTVKGQVLLYSEQRVGGNITDSSALKAIKTAAA